MTLHEVAKRLESTVTEHQRMWQDVHIKTCHWCWMASVLRIFVAEVKRLR